MRAFVLGIAGREERYPRGNESLRWSDAVAASTTFAFPRRSTVRREGCHRSVGKLLIVVGSRATRLIDRAERIIEKSTRRCQSTTPRRLRWGMSSRENGQTHVRTPETTTRVDWKLTSAVIKSFLSTFLRSNRFASFREPDRLPCVISSGVLSFVPRVLIHRRGTERRQADSHGQNKQKEKKEGRK